MDEQRKRQILDKAGEKYTCGGSLNLNDWAREECDDEEAGFRRFILRHICKQNSRGPCRRIFSLGLEDLEGIYHLSTMSPVDRVIRINGRRVNLTDIAEKIAGEYLASGSKRDIAVVGAGEMVQNEYSLAKLMEFEIARFAPARVVSIESRIWMPEIFYRVDLDRYLNQAAA